MVYFVGAGPGAVDLITVRGQNLLSKADIVIYAGSLVNPALLALAEEACEIYNSAAMTLEEVIAVMVEGDRRGKEIVRLHTGDPSIYGAIREQMDLLDKHHINYQVVPGVSSFSAAAAAIPGEYTLPGVSQTVILTRMAGRTPVPEKEDISLLAAHQASMVIFLSSGMLEELGKKLVIGGYSGDTPVAIVYKASWPEEKIIRTCIKDMVKTARENNISKTALILVGNFLGDGHTRSLLYHPDFQHGFRQGAAEGEHHD